MPQPSPKLPASMWTDIKNANFWPMLAKENYVEYRKLKLAKLKGLPSLKLISRIQDLDPKFAFRPKIPSSLQSEQIASAAIAKNQANAAAKHNEEIAKKQLESFLNSKALSVQEELEMLALYLISKSPAGTKWLPGPLKKLDKALSKTHEDYDDAWSMNKDLIRGTLVYTNPRELQLIGPLMPSTCTAELGMSLIKNVWQQSVRNGGTMKAGYSGWNFAIQFQDHPAFAVELQANTFRMIYGKTKKKDYCSGLKVSEADYAALQSKYQFPGAIAHGLYDIQDIKRSAATEEEAVLARELSLDYYDACRGEIPKSSLDALNKRISEFGGKLTSNNAKAIWKEIVDESGWKGYVFQMNALSPALQQLKRGRGPL